VSVEAITWALGLKLERSSTKFVLVAMANCADAENTCWPSVAYLCEATCQDRKTVMENIRRLEALGLLEDTGQRRGKTAQVPIYRVTPNGTKNGTGTENGTVPKTEPNSTVFPPKQYRFSVETVPKTGHGTVNTQKEPSRNPKKRAKPDEVSVTALVDAGFDAETAAEFIATKRQRKAPLTPRAWADHQREAIKAGWSVQQAAEKVMAKTWKGFEASYVQSERPPSRAAPQSFRESDRRADEAKVAFLTGRKPQVFEATDVTPRRVDREDFLEVVGDVRPGLPAPVRRG
jgi:hypothetical protein